MASNRSFLTQVWELAKFNYYTWRGVHQVAEVEIVRNDGDREWLLVDPLNPSKVLERSTERDIIDKYYNDTGAKRITDKIDHIEGPLYQRYTISDWQLALRDATRLDQYNPNWSRLFDIIDNIELDPHIAACIKTRKERIQAKQFYFEDVNGDKLDDITELFERSWFRDLVDILINSKLNGFALAQFGDFLSNEQSYKEVTEIPRKHVRPDLNGVVWNEYDTVRNATWESGRYKNWTLYSITDKRRRLGDLATVGQWYIIKQEVMRTWAITNALYGTVPLIAKTALTDRQRKDNMINFMKNFSGSYWAVISEKDEIEALNISRANVKDMYEAFINLCDKQASKALLGSTMVLDDGSSRSQSETHENQTRLFIQADARMIEFIVNEQLLDKMRAVGFNIPEGRWKWDNSEQLTILEQAQVIEKLLPHYNIAPDEIADKLGIEVEEKEQEAQMNNMQQLSNYYANLANKHKSCNHG